MNCETTYKRTMTGAPGGTMYIGPSWVNGAPCIILVHGESMQVYPTYAAAIEAAKVGSCEPGHRELRIAW